MQPKSMPSNHGHHFGSLAPNTPDTERRRLQKREAFGLLERVGQELELTQTQHDRAEQSYQAVAEWLSDVPLLADLKIYLQGSTAIGTTCKPIGSNEHDVDAIGFLPAITTAHSPAQIKQLIGDRLRAHAYYRKILEEKARCWRLNYAGDFRLDLTPSIKNPLCSNGGELVPDRKLEMWKPTNPKGYRNLFDRRANLAPRSSWGAQKGRMAKADIEPFPEQKAVKGVLRRTVQLQKRHRDIDFIEDNRLAPLSIIITTLASQAYEWCVTHHIYDNELDLLCDTIRAMPWFIEADARNGFRIWLVPNETTAGENFAEKWNVEPAKAKAFFAWHERALADFEEMKDLLGADAINRHLSPLLGEEPVRKAASSLVTERTAARQSGRLAVTSGLGLGAAAVGSTSVRANTFFGR